MNTETNQTGRFRQGRFHPRYPEKYLGDVNNITYRSSWELKAFQMLDGNPNVLYWGSEIIPIAYTKPLPNGGMRPATYFPDLFVVFKHQSGEVRKELIEIKPLKQTQTSKARKSTTKLQENYTYLVNQCKWEAAKAWCFQNGIAFKICTEQSLFRT